MPHNKWSIITQSLIKHAPHDYQLFVLTDSNQERF